jgi:hypothetical protein
MGLVRHIIQETPHIRQPHLLRPQGPFSIGAYMFLVVLDPMCHHFGQLVSRGKIWRRFFVFVCCRMVVMMMVVVIMVMRVMFMTMMVMAMRMFMMMFMLVFLYIIMPVCMGVRMFMDMFMRMIMILFVMVFVFVMAHAFLLSGCSLTRWTAYVSFSPQEVR